MPVYHSVVIEADGKDDGNVKAETSYTTTKIKPKNYRRGRFGTFPKVLLGCVFILALLFLLASIVQYLYENFVTKPDKSLEAYDTVAHPQKETQSNFSKFIAIGLTSKLVASQKLPDRSRNKSIWLFGFILITIIALISFVLTFGVFKLVDVLSSAETDKHGCFTRIVGYYTDYDYRNITEAQVGKLTHIIYRGTKWKPDGKIEFKYPESHSSFFGLRNKTRTVNPNIKIMFSTDTYLNNDHNFSSIMSESKTRKILIDFISSFIYKHHLDGVELFYKWPTSKEDKDSFEFFVRELRHKLGYMERISRGNASYVMSIVAPRQTWAAESGSIIFDLLPSVDFFNVEADNDSLAWHKTDSSMKAYTCITKLPSKFNVVIPIRGVLWKNVEDFLQNDDQYRVISVRNGSGVQVSFKKEWNSLSANCDDVLKIPYIWDPKNHTLLTFENERSLKEKMKYMVSKNLGGITIDSLEWDDDSNTFLNALTSVNLCPKRKNENDTHFMISFGRNNCSSNIRTLNHSQQNESLLFPRRLNSLLFDRSRNKSRCVSGFILLTILVAISCVLTFGIFKLVDVLSSTGTKWKLDGKIEFENLNSHSSFFGVRQKARRVNPDIKIMFSTDTYLNNYQDISSMMSESKTRNKLIDSISSFIHKHQLDGVELFYKWPESKEDKDNFVFFVRELRYKLENMERTSNRNAPYIMSIVAPRQMEKSESTIFDLFSSVDFFTVETNNYSLSRHQTGMIGPKSPLYSKNNESIDATMKAYTCITNLPSKFNFVVPFSGVLWKNGEDPFGMQVPFTKIFRSFSPLWDDITKTPYFWDPRNETFTTFENERSLKEKMKYMVSKNLGGITIDSLEWDDDSDTLLNALTSFNLCPEQKKWKG